VNKSWWIIVSAAPLTAFAAGSVLPDRPPLAHTGGFGERTCQECHTDNPLNDPVGQLELTGMPEAYQPRRAYSLVVRLIRKDLGRAGFELATRVAQGGLTGHQAGKLEATDTRVNVADSTPADFGPVQYARHTREGSAVTSDTTQWTVKWTAPAAGMGAVILNLVANAGNDDNSPLGDYIYSKTITARPSEAANRKGR
jgi:hypothetical protein